MFVLGLVTSVWKSEFPSTITVVSWAVTVRLPVLGFRDRVKLLPVGVRVVAVGVAGLTVNRVTLVPSTEIWAELSVMDPTLMVELSMDTVEDVAPDCV